MFSLPNLLLLFLAQFVPVPAGTRIEARLGTPVHTATSKAGDEVVAMLSKPIRANGIVIVPLGSRLNGRIETIEPATHDSEGRVRFVFRQIDLPDGRHASTWMTTRRSNPRSRAITLSSSSSNTARTRVSATARREGNASPSSRRRSSRT